MASGWSVVNPKNGLGLEIVDHLFTVGPVERLRTTAVSSRQPSKGVAMGKTQG
jgi:hypothetical protein